MAKKKELKVTSTLTIVEKDGTRLTRRWEDIPEEEQKELGRLLSDTAMEAAGYKRLST